LALTAVPWGCGHTPISESTQQASVLAEELYGVRQGLWTLGRNAKTGPFAIDDGAGLAFRHRQNDEQPHGHRFKKLGRDDGSEQRRVAEMDQSDADEAPGQPLTF
jgi:hypothetical protein